VLLWIVHDHDDSLVVMVPLAGPAAAEAFDAVLEGLGVRERVTLVVHDWGSGLGFDWASRHRQAVRGIAHMGPLVQPRGWNDWPESARGLLQTLRSPAGEKLALEQPLFKQVLTSGVLRQLSEEELAEYRRPFANPGKTGARR
jgi:haloalkane dehalogenase